MRLLRRESVEEKHARLRALAEDYRLLGFQLLMLRERRDALALELVEASESWRSVAESGGFANPYIAQLKRKARAGV